MRRGRRDVVDGIDFGGERDEVVVASGVGDGVAENEADDGADDSMRTPWAMKTGGFVFSWCQRHEDGDVFGLFHDIMIREMRMLRAATKTIRPMVMKVTTRSSGGRGTGLVLFHPVGGHEAVAS